MAFTDIGVRVGAVAFAVGLALAGPQAAGVAAADRGDADASSSSPAEVRGDTRGGADVSASDEGGDGASASSDEPTGTDQDPAVGEPTDAEPDPVAEDPAEEPAAETLPGSDVEPVLDEPVLDDPVDDVADEPVAEEPGTQEPVVVVDPEAPETTVTGDAKEPPAQPDSGDVDEPVVLPTRGGPDPLPWWRTTTAAGGSEGSEGAEASLPEPGPAPVAGPVDYPVWLYSVGTVGPSEPTNTSPAGNPANQAIDSLRVQATAVIDQVVEWLNGLPANAFTEFLSGALLLLRRALMPETPARTDDPGNSISDPEPEIPRGLVGLTEDEAVQAAMGAGWNARIVSRDGEDFMVTKDYLLTRVNFTVVDGVVTAVYVG